MEKENSFENSSEQESQDEESVGVFLAQELKDMEERSPNTRKNGEGDIKYKILYKFVEALKQKDFQEAYQGLNDVEKHVIITRLENQAYLGNLTYDFVEKFRRDLYGAIKDEEGEEKVDFQKQSELEKELQEQTI